MTKENPPRKQPQEKTNKPVGATRSKPPANPTRQAAKQSPKNPRTTKNAARGQPTTSSPRLLSGGNPQIPMGYGEEPIRKYIAAMPGWKKRMGKRIDAMIASSLSQAFLLQKAVKWNSPLYGRKSPDGEYEWFLSVHCFEKYIKVAFFRGASLTPPPPEASKQADVRYLHIREDWGNDPRDEAQFAEWVRQASRLPGERM